MKLATPAAVSAVLSVARERPAFEAPVAATAQRFAPPAGRGGEPLYLSLVPKIWFPLAGAADLSYGLYLYGWPVQQILVPYASGPAMNFVTALAVAGICASLSWIAIERTVPARRRQSSDLLSIGVARMAGSGRLEYAVSPIGPDAGKRGPR